MSLRPREEERAAVVRAGRVHTGAVVHVERGPAVCLAPPSHRSRREATTGAPPDTPARQGHTNETLRAAVQEWLSSEDGRAAAEGRWGTPITHWNTSEVLDMSGLFCGAGFFNEPLAWDTRNVTDMHNMFCDAWAFNNGGQPLAFDTSNVTTMEAMFRDARNFDQPLAWDTRNVTDMHNMFRGARAFNNDGRPLAFVTSNVTNMESMFLEATSFNQPLAWDTRKVTDMRAMFCDATAFNQPLAWDTRNVTNMEAMFSDARAFNNAGRPLPFDTRNVTDMRNMCWYARAFNQTLAFDTRHVTDMAFMFRDARAFNNDGRPLAFDTRNVTDMRNMFWYARAFNQTLAWDTRSVTNMSYMFFHAAAFNQPLEWDTRNVNDMQYMFASAAAFNNGDQPLEWDTRNVTRMNGMFADARAINQQLAWDITNVTERDRMFIIYGDFHYNDRESPSSLTANVLEICATLATSDRRRAAWDAKYASQLLDSLYDALLEANAASNETEGNNALRKRLYDSDGSVHAIFGLPEGTDLAAIQVMEVPDVLQRYLYAIRAVRESVDGQTTVLENAVLRTADSLLEILGNEDSEAPRERLDSRAERRGAVAAELQLTNTQAAAVRLRLGTLRIGRVARMK